jgi:hypothetical protein
MKINKLIKRFSLLAISYFCLTATHVAAQDFVKVKNQSKYAIIVRMGDLYSDSPVFSECMLKGEDFTYNLDEIGVKRGDFFELQYKPDFDCPFTEEKKWVTDPNRCVKRKDGEGNDKYKWRRSTGSGTKIFAVRNNGKKIRCVVE